MPGVPLAFHVMAKPTGAICNLDCEYCFFLSKEMLYPGSRFRMADELLETYLRQLIDESRASAVLTFGNSMGGYAAILVGILRSMAA